MSLYAASATKGEASIVPLSLPRRRARPASAQNLRPEGEIYHSHLGPASWTRLVPWPSQPGPWARRRAFHADLVQD